jgi:glycosyltransferase involved in cell wall biosynthesis
MAMRIGIFAMTLGSNGGGPEIYESQLVRSLVEGDEENEYHLFCPKAAKTEFLPNSPNLHHHYIWPNARWISLPTSLPYLLLKSEIQVLHATFIPPPISPKRYVFTMHCSSHFVHPEFYDARILWRLNKFLDLGMRKASQIMCVSEHVRELVSERYGVKKDRLPVVYHGVDERFRPIERKLACEKIKSYGIESPFLLYVGKLTARKNIVRILEAYHRFRNEDSKDLKLVLVGKRTWKAEGIEETIERLDLKDSIIELGYVRHEDLPCLYAAAELFLFPSLWEGFGIPVIEAMACGTPVITSNNSCLPEVAGGAALLVNPYSVDDIADGIKTVLDDSAYRETLRNAGFARAREFTWQRTAAQSLQVYRAAI